jgi:hypothetical protein
MRALRMGVDRRLTPINRVLTPIGTLMMGVSSLRVGASHRMMGPRRRLTPISGGTTPIRRLLMGTKALGALIIQAKGALAMTDEQLGDAVGAARKTVGRWCAGVTAPAGPAVLELARLVQPKDAALALSLVRAVNAHLQSIGAGAYAVPEQPFVPVDKTKVDVHKVDAVVCAACDAADASPKVIRRALQAAFERAKTLGLDVEALSLALKPGRTSR